MKWGDEYPARCDLSSLRLLGSVGEPINPGAWLWYQDKIGGGRCPVIDTWWQTETGDDHGDAPSPASRPYEARLARPIPFPGVEITVIEEDGDARLPSTGPRSASHNPQSGFLVIKKSLARHDARHLQRAEAVRRHLLVEIPGKVLRRAMACGWTRTATSGFWDAWTTSCSSRATTSLPPRSSRALVSHPAVAEAAVIGKTHEIKGQAIAAFVILRGGASATPDELKRHVAGKLGVVCRPDDVFLTAELPKTRSGKIMRRLLRDVAEGRALGDTTTLADPTVVAALKEGYEEKEV